MMGIYVNGIEMPKEPDEMIELAIFGDGKTLKTGESWRSPVDGKCYYGTSEDMNTYFAEELSKPQWIPVTERLPDNIDEEVLVCNEGYGKDGTGFATVAVYNGNGWLECWERKQYLACITHWMQLPSAPEPPKEE